MVNKPRRVRQEKSNDLGRQHKNLQSKHDMSDRFRWWRADMGRKLGGRLTLEAVREAVNKHLQDNPIGSTQTIDNYEGNYLPSTKFLVALKKAYPNDLDLNWLMFGDKGMPGDTPPGPPPRPLSKRKLGRRYFSRWNTLGGAVGMIDRFLLRLSLFYPDAYPSGESFELAISDPKARICELDKWLEKWALSPFKQLPEHFIGTEDDLTHVEAVTYCHAILAAIRPLLRVLREDTRVASEPGLPPGFVALFSGLDVGVQKQIGRMLAKDEL